MAEVAIHLFVTSVMSRKAFLKLPMKKRRELLRKYAEKLKAHYDNPESELIP